MIQTKKEEFKREAGVLVVSEAKVDRDEFLKLLVDNGFEVAEGCKWNIVDDQKSITIKASGMSVKVKSKSKVKVQEEEDDPDLEYDC